MPRASGPARAGTNVLAGPAGLPRVRGPSAAVAQGLARGRLVGHHSLAGHPRLSAAGRVVRKNLLGSGAEGLGDRKVAVLRAAGIPDAGLRGILDTPDQPGIMRQPPEA